MGTKEKLTMTTENSLRETLGSGSECLKKISDAVHVHTLILAQEAEEAKGVFHRC